MPRERLRTTVDFQRESRVMSFTTTKTRQGAALEVPRLLLRAWLRRLGVFRIRDLDRIDAVVISPGGVGSTLLIDQLRPHVRVNSRDDEDHLKHLPRLPDRFPDRLRIIFIHGDVEDVVHSIHRRGWTARHGSKLASVESVIASGSAQTEALRRAVERQIEWFARCDRPGLLRVRYEELWDRLDEIATFLGIDAEAFRAEFPSRHPRTGDEAPAVAIGTAAETEG